MTKDDSERAEEGVLSSRRLNLTNERVDAGRLKTDTSNMVTPAVRKTSLVGKRIVVTRPADDAARLANRLRGLGAEAVVVPAIRIEFTDPPELARALAELDHYDWIIFTSRYAVQAVFRMADRLTGPRIAAIGPATATALERRGVPVDLVPAEYVAEALLEALGDVAGRRILLPRADAARPALANGLHSKGARVTRIAAYRTVRLPAEPSLLAGADAITFTSSSTARAVLESGPLPAGVNIVCIGPITAATVTALGAPVAATAREYTEDGLIEAVLDVFDRGR